MKRALAMTALVAVAAVATGCASGESFTKPGFDFCTLERVAVAQVDGPVGGRVAEAQLGDFFSMELLRRGYDVVERAQVQMLLDEQDFQVSALTTSAGIARAGEILNVDAMLFVNVPEFGETINMTAKLVDVQTGSVLWMGAGRGATGRLLGTLGGAAVGGALGVAAGGDSTGRAVAGIGGAALGGAAGYSLTPQKATAAQKVVKSVCESMPSRI